MNISTRDFAATRRFLRRRMATPIQPSRDGVDNIGTFLYGFAWAIVIGLILRCSE